MRRRDLDQELSFREAAELLSRRRDSRGRGLKKMVLARERQTGKQIAIRLDGPKEPKMRITIGALYRSFPELAPARLDDIARMVAPMMKRAEGRTREVVRDEIAKTVEPRLTLLEKEGRILTRTLKELAALRRQ